MTLAFNDYIWRLDPKVDGEELRQILEHFPRLKTLPGAQVLKENQLRTVVYVPSSRGTDGADSADIADIDVEAADRSSGVRQIRGVIAKLYRYRSAAERLRYRFRRTRAEQEWYALGRFRDLELPAAAPLAVGQCHRGTRLEAEGVLLEYLPGCRSLVDALDADRGETENRTSGFLLPGDLSVGQRATIELAARRVRTLHDKGAWHRDLHAGNVLIDQRGGQLFFIDLHSCWFWSRLRRWQRRGGVLDLLYSLSWTLPPEGIDLFLDAYGRDVLFGAATRERVRGRVRKALESRDRKRLESRSKRCFKRSTMFDIANEGATRTYHLRQRPREQLAALWTREPEGAVLKRSSRGWVAEARVGDDDVCVKYRAYTWLQSLRSLAIDHRLRRAYAMGHGLRVRRIATPRVIALHECRQLGCVREAYLVTELIPRAARLDRFLTDEYRGKRLPPGPSSRRKHDLARLLGRFLRGLHDAKISPRDLSPQNLLVTDRWFEEKSRGEGVFPLYLVDLDDVRVVEPVSLGERGKNLVQLGNLPEGHITTMDLLRALRAYAGGDERYWNRRWILELRESLLKEHLRVVMRRSSGLPGKRL